MLGISSAIPSISKNLVFRFIGAFQLASKSELHGRPFPRQRKSVVVLLVGKLKQGLS